MNARGFTSRSGRVVITVPEGRIPLFDELAHDSSSTSSIATDLSDNDLLLLRHYVRTGWFETPRYESNLPEEFATLEDFVDYLGISWWYNYPEFIDYEEDDMASAFDSFGRYSVDELWAVKAAGKQFTTRELAWIYDQAELHQAELDMVRSDLSDNDDAYLADELFAKEEYHSMELSKYEPLIIEQRGVLYHCLRILAQCRAQEIARYVKQQRNMFRFQFWSSVGIDPVGLLPLRTMFKKRTKEEQQKIDERVAVSFLHRYEPTCRFVSWEYAGALQKVFLTQAKEQEVLARQLFTRWLS
jgi:hypothetical protein